MLVWICRFPLPFGVREGLRFVIVALPALFSYLFVRLFVDFEKEFDSVSWSFKHKVLELFGFGDSLIPWIKVLNKNAKLAVNQGENLSPFFFTLGEDVDKGILFQQVYLFYVLKF